MAPHGLFASMQCPPRTDIFSRMQCSTCAETGTAYQQLPCNHVCCAACVDVMVLEGSVCIVCRTPFESVRALLMPDTADAVSDTADAVLATESYAAELARHRVVAETYMAAQLDAALHEMDACITAIQQQRQQLIASVGVRQRAFQKSQTAAEECAAVTLSQLLALRAVGGRALPTQQRVAPAYHFDVLSPPAAARAMIDWRWTDVAGPDPDATRVTVERVGVGLCTHYRVRIVAVHGDGADMDACAIKTVCTTREDSAHKVVLDDGVHSIVLARSTDDGGDGGELEFDVHFRSGAVIRRSICTPRVLETLVASRPFSSIAVGKVCVSSCGMYMAVSHRNGYGVLLSIAPDTPISAVAGSRFCDGTHLESFCFLKHGAEDAFVFRARGDWAVLGFMSTVTEQRSVFCPLLNDTNIVNDGILEAIYDNATKVVFGFIQGNLQACFYNCVDMVASVVSWDRTVASTYEGVRRVDSDGHHFFLTCEPQGRPEFTAQNANVMVVCSPTPVQQIVAVKGCVYVLRESRVYRAGTDMPIASNVVSIAASATQLFAVLRNGDREFLLATYDVEN